jgi:hypothetical protein
MTTIEKLHGGLVHGRAKADMVDTDQEAVDVLPSPHGSPVSVEEPETGAGPAGWYPDPTERHDLRFFDGKQWTSQRTRILPIEPVRRNRSPAPVRS